MKISDVFAKYQTDKNTCIVGGHCYGKAYDLLFKSFNRLRKLDIVEIGVWEGQSLLAWREYFPNARISGIDNQDLVENKREDIEYIITDVHDFEPEKEYDIVIDDGSHQLEDVLCTVEKFKLKEGGMMILEDCSHPHYWIRKIKNRTLYSIEAIDFRRLYQQKDNFMIVLRNYGLNL